MDEVLRIEDLHTHFATKDGVAKVLNGVSLTIQENSIYALVGESGAGKSMTALSILGLVPFPGKVVRGRVLFDGMDLRTLSDDRMRKIRGKEISIVFQDPRAALNPILTIGAQVAEGVLAHGVASKKEAERMAEGLLAQAGLPDPRRILRSYPFQLSGGMCQRVMLSIGLALKPKVLIADEPTSNLDATLQAELLARLKRLAREMHVSILLITHDLGIVAQMADQVGVMYAGSIVEQATVRELFRQPRHPYTWGLFQALPRMDQPVERLRSLRGSAPDPMNLPDHCPFIPRCPKATSRCRLEPMPPMTEMGPQHTVACYNTISYD
ncbi:MAG: ABC transporter ATP-binding protein [Chloroflexota bacterium]|nr:ABC transporter ATP-binding protein [Chloroflexota bacterium]